VSSKASQFKNESIQKRVSSKASQFKNKSVQKRVSSTRVKSVWSLRAGVRFSFPPQDWTKVAFEKLVQDAINENRPAAEQKKITLRASGLDTSYSLELDAGKMQRVVGELVSNAIKYTPEGGTVEIDLRKEDDSFLLSVQDSGS